MADKPFPTNEAELNLLLQTFKAKLGGYQVTLDLTTGEVDAIVKDADNFEYLINTAPQVDDGKQAFFQFKEGLIDGEPSTVQAAVPVLPVITMPQKTFPGIKRRARNIIQRIKRATGYTTTIGEDLGLIDDSSSALPETLTAALAVVAKSDSRVEVTFSKQSMDAMKIEFRRKGDTGWTLVTIATASPFMHEADPATPGDPEIREYRGSLMQKNAPVGIMSPVYSVITTP